MKVSEIINKINDIEACIKYLECWKKGEITNINQIEAIVKDTENHLDDYIDLLKNQRCEVTL